MDCFISLWAELTPAQADALTTLFLFLIMVNEGFIILEPNSTS